jgi:hypothetical protein
MHQRGIGWTCLRRRPRQTPANRSDHRGQTRGTHLRRPRSLARSLRQLKYTTSATGKQVHINNNITSNEL